MHPYYYFCYLSIFLGFIPLSLFLISKSKLSKDVFLILPFLVLTFFASTYELIFTLILKIEPYTWFKVYTSLEFFFLLHYFYKLLRQRYKYLYLFFGVLYTACLGLIVFHGKIDVFMDGDGYLQVIESVFVITAILLWMQYAFIRLQEDSLLKYSHFYFISGLLFYFSGTLFLFLFGHFVLGNADEFVEYWMLNLFFNIIFKLLLLVGIWKARVQ